MVHDHRARFQQTQEFRYNATHVVIVAYAERHKSASSRSFSRRIAGLAAMRSYPCRSLFRRPIKNVHLVPGFGEVSRHRKAHYTQANKGNFHHLLSSGENRLARNSGMAPNQREKGASRGDFVK